ncbi:2,3-dihydro-2,3-dihydroxybenzoate dehydrogenase [Salmonella enterica subsp. enterica]|uniref:2,3-dihydro-2,3-dihydroxybenzoate dehydrogenase n=1 Tax=Salmonella enterica I TaxID=59201 RepID=A0A447U7Y5_SALET|nr:2,3-dihydro-2,3-dihydroxybenzoate dehydrogenase [Salmonella enterica subsp. enterica]
MDVADAAQVAQVWPACVAKKRRGWMCWSTPPVFWRMGATDALSVDGLAARRLRSMWGGGILTCFSQTMAQFRRQQGGADCHRSPQIAAHTPRIGMSAYGASKAALKKPGANRRAGAGGLRGAL